MAEKGDGGAGILKKTMLLKTDPRTTDNSWVETKFIGFHDETGAFTEGLELSRERADKAAAAAPGTVAWVSITPNCDIYQPHVEFALDIRHGLVEAQESLSRKKMQQ